MTITWLTLMMINDQLSNTRWVMELKWLLFCWHSKSLEDGRCVVPVILKRSKSWKADLDGLVTKMSMGIFHLCASCSNPTFQYWLFVMRGNDSLYTSTLHWVVLWRDLSSPLFAYAFELTEAYRIRSIQWVFVRNQLKIGDLSTSILP